MNGTPPESRGLDRLSITDRERAEELLADRALFGLTPAESADLAALLPDAGGRFETDADALGYELAAAAATVSLVAGDRNAEPVSATLRERLSIEAAAFDFATAGLRRAEGGSPRRVAPERPHAAAPPAQSWWALPFALAVAASLLAAIWVGGPSGPFASPSLVVARAGLINNAADVVRIAWAAQEDAALAEEPTRSGESPWGDVVWSDSAQAGYLRFRGLRPNDPSVEQYQLWVFDEARNAEHPVDGGVFDISATDLADDGEAIVSIDAKLPVSRATLFAITVERPGGVVVSDRSRLPLLASR
ncbi:MAG: anti-sigma factor [Planctomycetota bacterium]